MTDKQLEMLKWLLEDLEKTAGNWSAEVLQQCAVFESL